MGMFDFLKKQKAPPANSPYRYAPTMNSGRPFYTSFGDNVYASDIVVQSIRCKANEFKKLEPRHIRTTGGLTATITDSSIANVLKRPNPFMTQADFLEKCAILLELNKNVYIYPEYYVTKGGEKHFTGLYPLKPNRVEYLVDGGGRYYITLGFASGYEVTLPASDVVHWRKDYGVNDYFGGGMFGGNDQRGLLAALDRYDKLCQSIAKAVEVSCTINGIMKVNTYLDDDKIEARRNKFEEKLRNNESGILFEDMKSDFTALPHDVKLVDAETLKFFNDTILRANGTSLAILNGDYTKAQKEAYYEHALEADIKALGQAISKTVFSDREMQFGNEIVLYPHEINFMSMENKIAVLQVGLPAGLFLKDEARALIGYAPLPNGAGQTIAQGYNSLLDANNDNKLKSEGGPDDGGQE